MLSFLRNKNLNRFVVTVVMFLKREENHRDEKEMEGGSNPRMTGGV